MERFLTDLKSDWSFSQSSWKHSNNLNEIDLDDYPSYKSGKLQVEADVLKKESCSRTEAVVLWVQWGDLNVCSWCWLVNFITRHLWPASCVCRAEGVKSQNGRAAQCKRLGWICELDHLVLKKNKAEGRGYWSVIGNRQHCGFVCAWQNRGN